MRSSIPNGLNTDAPYDVYLQDERKFFEGKEGDDGNARMQMVYGRRKKIGATRFSAWGPSSDPLCSHFSCGCRLVKYPLSYNRGDRYILSVSVGRQIRYIHTYINTRIIMVLPEHRASLLQLHRQEETFFLLYGSVR